MLVGDDDAIDPHAVRLVFIHQSLEMVRRAEYGTSGDPPPVQARTGSEDPHHDFMGVRHFPRHVDEGTSQGIRAHEHRVRMSVRRGGKRSEFLPAT